ncbi:MAG: hypothetical protein ACXWQ5_01010 [Ktedonobacterales bacterium]
MLTTVDLRRESILLIDGKYVPALKVHVDDHDITDPRPNPHHVMNVMCTNRTIKHDGAFYVLFTNTHEWDEDHHMGFDKEHDAEAFLRAYRVAQLDAYDKANPREKIVLYRVDGILRSNPYTPYEQTWNLYDSRDDDEPYDPECCVCQQTVGSVYYLSETGDEACTDDVIIVGED